MISPSANAGLIRDHVAKTFPQFGPNKHQEITRLLYEITRRDGGDFRTLLPADEQSFLTIKNDLLRRRYPNTDLKHASETILLPKLDIDPAMRVDASAARNLDPRRFFIERSVRDTGVVRHVQDKFSDAEITWIDSYKEVVQSRTWSPRDYNERLNAYYLVREEYDFYKRCACSVKSVYCGYHVVNLGSGCGFDCAYCYLQDYINSPGIVLPANIEDFFDQFSQYKADIRLGSGEITDSLIFDHITGYAPRIVEFFRDYPGSTFEFKTKSVRVENLLAVRPAENIVVAWSMNPQNVIDAFEHYTARLDERLEAAAKCVEAGYRVGFHFDPMIHFPGWEEAYGNLVERIYDTIDRRRIAWLSLGALRMTPRLKKIIENRFPDSAFLNDEFYQSYDGKLRYGFHLRTRMYQVMKDLIRGRDPDTYIYLCMEEKNACGTCQTAPLKEFARN